VSESKRTEELKHTEELANESIDWLIDALSSNKIEVSESFLLLSPASQFLTNHMLRVLLRSLLDVAQIDHIDFIAALSPIVRAYVGLHGSSAGDN
jgi:cellobiose-specific phosphotransferase system component IIB